MGTHKKAEDDMILRSMVGNMASVHTNDQIYLKIDFVVSSVEQM